MTDPVSFSTEFRVQSKFNQKNHNSVAQVSFAVAQVIDCHA